MYVDKGLQIDPGLDLDGAAANWYGTNCVDLALAGRDVGKGRQMYMVITVTEAFVNASAASTTIFSLVEDADGPTAIDDDSIIVLSTEGFAVAALTLGAQIVIPVPPGIALRYLGLRATTSQELTYGVVSAQIVLEAQTN